jgi:hypothetical protein
MKHGETSMNYNILIALPMINLPMIKSMFNWECLNILKTIFLSNIINIETKFGAIISIIYISNLK